jgi:hypothetical protein
MRTNPDSRQPYLNAANGNASTVEKLKTYKRAWSSRITGKLWLIRPDERELADYSLVRITPP